MNNSQIFVKNGQILVKDSKFLVSTILRIFQNKCKSTNYFWIQICKITENIFSPTFCFVHNVNLLSPIFQFLSRRFFSGLCFSTICLFPNFTNILRAAFMQADPKIAKKSQVKQLFALSGSASVKAARNHVDNIDP